MKIKILLLVLSTLPLLIYGQSVEPNCVSCLNNQIDTKKGASAIGQENKSLGINSFAAGYLNEAIGDYSVAMPFLAKANGHRSLAFGYYAVADGAGSLALGTYAGTGANGTLSIAIGSRVSSDMTNSMVLGFGHASAILINDVEKSLMVGFNSNKPTFFVGPASGVDKTGKVGIGNITSPTHKLHIKADDNEDASLKLEPTGTNNLALISLGNNGHGLSVQAGGDLKFKTQSGKGFFFENGKVITTGLQLSTGSGAWKMLQSDNSGNATWAEPAWVTANGNIHRMNGNVGIGTTNPVQKLDINGTLKATGFIMATGAGLGKVLTSDASGNAAWQVIPEDGHWFTSGDNIYRINGNVGIGTQSPQAMLHVNGDLKLLSDNPTYQFQILSNGQVPARRGISLTDDPDGAFNFYIHGWQTDAAFNFINGQNNNYLMKIANNGNVGIGTTNTSEAKLTVAGKIHAKEIKVTIDAGGGADFVFDDDYVMQSLKELDSFVKLNRHLPGIQSAKMMENDGVNLGEMQMILLQKIEELTLYAIEQDNKIALLNDQLNNLLRRIQDEDN